MRASAAAAWPAFCASYEGRCTWLYLDTLKLPTTGLGHRVFTVADMVALPWRKGDRAATEAEKRAEWAAIGKRIDLAPRGGFAYRSVATLHLTDATVDGLLVDDTPRYWDPLVKVLPNLEQWPADAQLALIDMAYNLGAYFLGSKWPNFTAACKRGDFTGAALFCLRAVKAPRDYRHQRMFTNAADVVGLGIDPDILWDAKTPTAPIVITPADPEEIPDVAKVKFRGGWTCSCVATSLPLVEQDMIRRGLIKFNIDIFQLGYNGGGVAASAGTHDAGGCTDVGQYNDAQIKVWREWGWTMQKRVGVGSGTHAHGWPYGCSHLSAGAKSQARDWDRKDSGLVGAAKVVGPWPIDPWNTAMKKRLAEIAKEQENELPTPKDVAAELAVNDKFLDAIAARVTAAVWSADVIPNTGLTSNAANKTVSPKTAFSQIGKKIDGVAAAVAAPFPEPATPPAA